MTIGTKETWESLALEAEQEEMARVAAQLIEEADAAAKDDSFVEDEGGFRLPYSTRPRATNDRWKK